MSPTTCCVVREVLRVMMWEGKGMGKYWSSYTVIFGCEIDAVQFTVAEVMVELMLRLVISSTVSINTYNDLIITTLALSIILFPIEDNSLPKVRLLFLYVSASTKGSANYRERHPKREGRRKGNQQAKKQMITKGECRNRKQEKGD